MARHNVISTHQASFLEAMLLGVETEPLPAEPTDPPSLVPEENPHPTVSPSPDEIADLFGFVTGLAQTKSDAAQFKTPHKARTDTEAGLGATQHEAENKVDEEDELLAIDATPEEPQPPFLAITPQWLFDHYPSLLAHIVAIWNAIRERAGLPLLENAEHILAAQLVHRLNVKRTDLEVEAYLVDCCRDLEMLAQRLYGDITHPASDEISRCADVLMQKALRQAYEDEELWIRQALEAAVRKVLAGQSDRIYSALVVSTLQRPFREIVRQLLQANELPFPKRVLAQAREKGYADTMRESLQTLARLGLTAQIATLAWEAARRGHTDTATPWIARRADGCAAAILEGYAIADQRVVHYPGYALLATFDAEQRVTRQMTIAITALEHAKQALWAQGYHRNDKRFPLPARVVQLWCDLCRGRDNGWWFGDQAGRVMVVIPYVMRSRLGYHKPLCRAVEQMKAWGYSFRYDDHTLWFLPAGVGLPMGAPIPTKEDNTDIST